MSRTPLAKLALTSGALVMATLPLVSAAQAQPGPQSYPQAQYPQGQYAQPQSAPPTRGDPANPSGYDYRNPPPEPGAPAGYDGRQLPPPPPGYQPTQDEAAQRAADDRYAADANRWARENCVKSRGDAGSGALIGGILGAIIGSSLGGRHDHGGSTFAGAAIGAVGGAAIGSSTGGDTSPGCPPGYSVRRDAVTYAYPVPNYEYAAPEWYRPWIFIDGNWAYRPYPYHSYYYRTWRAGPGYYRGGPGPYRGGHEGWEHGGRGGWEHGRR